MMLMSRRRMMMQEQKNEKVIYKPSGDAPEGYTEWSSEGKSFSTPNWGRNPNFNNNSTYWEYVISQVPTQIICPEDFRIVGNNFNNSNLRGVEKIIYRTTYNGKYYMGIQMHSDEAGYSAQELATYLQNTIFVFYLKF